MESILKVSDLNKSYGNFSLSNVSFSLPEGCITGFIGVKVREKQPLYGRF